MKTIKADFNQKTNKPLVHTWSRCIGAGRAAEGLRSGWQKQLKETVKECGFEYIRFHGLLAEDMFVVHRDEDGLHYNWTYIDELYDFLLEVGIRPVVEFGFMPPELASGEQTQFWWKGNVTPPSDYKEWGTLIYELVLHWKERYGLEEIRKWYYEVWNEPNLGAFWGGTRSQYFELYKVSAKAVRAVDGKLRVGGPATSNFVPDDRFEAEREVSSRQITHRVEDLDSLSWQGVWIEAFLEYCEREELPVDFISCHPYPTDFALDGQQEMKGRTRQVNSLHDDILWLKKTVEASVYSKAELLLTEWSSSPTSRDYSHDYLPAANYIVKSNIDNAGLVDCLSYWVFTDIFEEVGGGPETLHGGFGLLTMKGMKKPAYYAYRFLHELGETEVTRGDGYIVTKKADGSPVILCYNYAEEMKQAIPISAYPDHETAEKIQQMGEIKKLSILLENLKPKAVLKGSLLEAEDTITAYWGKLGYPKNLSRQQEEQMAAMGPKRLSWTADEEGRLKIEIDLPKWGILQIKE